MEDAVNKKTFTLLTILLIGICNNLFAEKILLERQVNNNVFRYYDKTWHKEQGTVKMYLNEFTSADGKEKFGWAYGIESDFINNAPENRKNENPIKELYDETDAFLMYYIKNGKFYIGSVWASGYKKEVTRTHAFYEFDIKDGYGLYFILAYADAVNMLLTGGNGIIYSEKFDINGNDLFVSSGDELEKDLSFYTGNIPDYIEYSTFRVNQGYTGYRTVNIRLIKYQHVEYDKWGDISNHYVGTAAEAGVRIADNLKKHGLWLVEWSPYGNLGEYLGKYNLRGGVIMCNWETFKDRYGDTEESLKETLKESPNFGNQLIDYQEIKPKKFWVTMNLI